MIYEFGRNIIHCCKCIKHFFRALFCKDYYTELYRIGLCGKYGKEEPFPIRYCNYERCPKMKGTNDEASD